ncbi:phospholipase D-like domain-containing protein [Stutzerimonas tarimensis]|uniref:Phosphatidylserine/phosphatidylglycerophosphate/ cardiolipin synthase family protein n=1 Tax=Stutzerimonas tarimensis TaxID=1507735 RepID=A0ABV7T1H8_9GAMM
MRIAGPVMPWCGGNRYELLIDGPAFFPVMLEAIGQARHRVDLEFYLVEDGECAERMIAALTAAAARGVRVRCLFDGFGCYKLGQPQRDRLVQGGIALRFYNPLAWRLRFRNLHRDHRKILLVDDSIGFTGGAGITDEFWNPHNGDNYWHDVMVAMRGPILEHWQRLFDAQWAHCNHRPIWDFPLPQRPPRLPDVPFGSQGMGRVAYAAARQHRDILHSLARHLTRAKRRIYLATPYFLPPGKVRRALMRAARRGVEVRLLLTSHHTDNPPVRYAGHRHYPRLLRAGVRIHEYQPHFLHMKMALVDDWVSLGSCNFDHWNLRWNLEANLEAVDPELATQVASCFSRDFAESREITLEHWRTRSLLKRVNHGFWGWLDRSISSFMGR